jgi:hypothetical protein
VGSFLLVALTVLASSIDHPDAGAGRDAARPSWLPRPRAVELREEAYYRLRRSGDGYGYESSTFIAHVARDGVATFRNKHTSPLDLLLPLGKVPKPKGPTLESTARDHFNGRPRAPRPVPETSPPPPGIDWQAACPPNVPCQPPPSATLLSVHGNFDLTDEIMRALGQDPYAREKARFLSSTFEFRMRLAVEARKQDVLSGLDRLPDRLDQLWADERYSARERRRLLYELWSEMDESPHGQRGAAAIVGFIRRRLPCGSASAYSSEELAAFQRLHPERTFLLPGDCPSPAP